MGEKYDSYDQSDMIQQPHQSHKRGSLPGPMGALNLYKTHQQRRLSERGLMVYKPSRPDIDLIRDFNANSNQRKHSTPNLMNFSTTNHQYPRRYSGSWGTMQGPGISAVIPSSSSAYRRNSSFAAFPSTGATAGIPESLPEIVSSDSSSNLAECAKKVQKSDAADSHHGGARKVLLRIQKNPAAKDSFVEVEPIENLYRNRSHSTFEDRVNFITNPFHTKELNAARRFSDTLTLRNAPSININGQKYRSKDAAGIVCSTGDLQNLKCLTSSAQEIRENISNSADEEKMDQENEAKASTRPSSPQKLGNRSRSFDAVVFSKKGSGSSWFSRRHLPISAKIPISLQSPTVSTSPTAPLSSQPMPILTLTNENDNQSELIEVPSPPPASPNPSYVIKSGERVKVPWDKEGFVLDAAILGSAIENHLKKGDMKQRRATFSTLYGQNINPDAKIPSRARSASACVIPSTILESMSTHEGNENTGESVSGASFSREAGTAMYGQKSASGYSTGPSRNVRSMSLTDEGSIAAGSAGSHFSSSGAMQPHKVNYYSIREDDESEESCALLASEQGTSSSGNNGLQSSSNRLNNNRVSKETDKASSSTSSNRGAPARSLSICGVIRDFFINTIRS